MTMTTVKIPSMIARGICVAAKIPRNLSKEAPNPPTSDGYATANSTLVTQYVNKSPKNAATNIATLLFTFAF